MNVWTRLLIACGDAALWLGAALKFVFGGLFAALDLVLDPVLSRVLWVLNPICTHVGDIVYAPLSLLPIGLGLIVLSAVAGVVMLLAFRRLSDQKAIGRAKDQIKANLLALKLYKDELRVTLLSQWRLLGAIGRLQRHMLAPVLWLLLPMLLGLAQMGIRYQWRPLKPGERALITMKLAGNPADPPTVSLSPTAGAIVEVGPVPARLDDGVELTWRVRGAEPGRHRLDFLVGGTAVAKELVVGDGFDRVSPFRSQRSWTTQLLYPAERPLPGDSSVQSIEIEYAGRDSWVYGADIWVLTFFVISMAAALICAPMFKVRF